MASSTRGLHLNACPLYTRLRLGVNPTLPDASTRRLPTGRGPRCHAMAALAPRPKEERLQPLERNLRLTQHRQQPLIRPQHALQSPPVLLLPLPRAEPLAQGLDLTE